MLKLLTINKPTMIVLKRRFLVTIVSLFMVISLFSQSRRIEIDIPDSPSVKVWTGIHLNKQIHNKLYASMKISFHTKTPFFTPRFSDIGLGYEIFDNFKVSAFYRFSNKFQTNEKRTYIELTYKKKFSNVPIKIGTRVRWQSKFNSEHQMTQNYIRPRITIGFCSPNARIRPYISGELFYNKASIVKRQRLSTGLALQLNSSTSMKFFGRLERFNPSTDDITENYTFNLSYQFKF